MSSKTNLIDKLKSITGSQPEVQKILVELVSAVPEGQDEGLLAQALEPYENGGVSLEFSASGGAHFDSKSNSVKIERSDDAVDMAHSILFETYNAYQRQDFGVADATFKTSNQTPLEYGKRMAQIEAVTTEKYIKLLRIMRQHFTKAPLSKLSKQQLDACMACRTSNDFIHTTMLTAHDTSAVDQRSMMTPRMYAYEAVMNLGNLSAPEKFKQLVAKRCGKADWKQVVGLKHFGWWFSACWKNTVTDRGRRPKLWLYSGDQASGAFAHELRRSKISAADLGFEGPMVAMAERLGRGLTVTPFRNSSEYREFKANRERHGLPG